MFRTALLLPVSILASVLAGAPALSAQCSRPPIPPGGFEVRFLPPESITYSDGVVAEGALRVPVDPPPSCGWPLVVYVHSLASTRDQDLNWQTAIASRGYAVWAYDVRGQTGAISRGEPGDSTLYGGVERFDLAEQIRGVIARHGGLVNPDRIAVMGDSQGGVHSWMAAVQSGRTLRVAGRGELVFPTITCIAPADYVPEPTRHRLRNGALFAALFLETLDPPSGIGLRVDADLRDTIFGMFEQDDPAAAEQFLLSDPARALMPGLASLDVPVLCRFAWHDSVCAAGPLFDVFESIPTTTPARLVVSTVGHSTPFNRYELAFKRDLVDRWFDRFLWDEINGVENESRYVLGAMPLDTAALADPHSLWSHLHVDELPAPGVAPRRLWLDAAGALSETEPQPGVVGRIEHRNTAGITRRMWREERELREFAAVQNAFPLSELAFEWTVDADAELIGSPRLRLRTLPNVARYSLAALLFARLPGGDDVMLAHWGLGVRGVEPGIERSDDIVLSPIATRLPAGATVRLVVRNLWIPESPHISGLVAVPCFEDADVDLLAGAGEDGSWCELPLRAPTVTLVASATALDLTAPERIEFELNAGADRGTSGYVFAGSGAGQTPGLDLPGGPLPVNVDGWFEVFGWIANSAEFPRFAGFLDGDGRATAALDLSALGPLPVDLLGLRFTFAAWVYGDPRTLAGSPSNPVEVVLR